MLKARRSCLYMAPRARPMPGSVPSSNAQANNDRLGDEIETIDAVDAHARHGPSSEATHL